MEAWQWIEIKRQIKEDHILVTMKFTRNGTGETSMHNFKFADEREIENEGSARFQQKADNLERSYSILNQFDIGEDSKEILIECIKAIKANPNVTFDQAKNWYDNNYPDAVWKSEKIIQRMRQWLQQEIGYIPTWDQFKNYVINHIFEGVDG